MQYLQDLARKVGRTTVDFVLPPRCVGTGDIVDSQGMVSPFFWNHLRFIADPVCVCCGYPLEINMKINEKALCGPCLQEKPLYARARACLAYDDTSRTLILKFKHGDMMHAEPVFLPWMMRAGDAMIREADIVVPVPLHWLRLIKRRYNQAALLAWGIARRSGKPCIIDGLIRRRATASQGHKKAGERRKNVRNAFTVNPKRAAALAGRKILLVDDVHTTGATANECAKTLIKAGASEVSVLTLARVVK